MYLDVNEIVPSRNYCQTLKFLRKQAEQTRVLRGLCYKVLLPGSFPASFDDGQ